MAHAGAAGVVARAPEVPGGVALVEIVRWDANGVPAAAPAPVLRGEGLEVGRPEPAGDGRWRVPVRTLGVAAARLHGTIGGDAFAPVEVTLPAARGCLGAGRVELSGAVARVTFPRLADDPTCPLRVDDLRVRASEGTVGALQLGPDAVRLEVAVTPDRNARVLAIGMADRARPWVAPVVAMAAVHGRPALALQAEPGSVVTVRVGRRAWGPLRADASGAVAVTLDTLPGETAYEVTVADEVGNVRRTVGPLPSSTRPVVLAFEDRLAGAWLAAWGPAGAAWRGAAPVCVGPGGMRPGVVSAGVAGAWRVQLPEGVVAAGLPVPLECTVDSGAASLRVPARVGRARRLELRVVPEVLSADFPRAQVNAVLLDEDGERVAPEGVAVVADRGSVVVDPDASPPGVGASYDGQAAAAAGVDTVRARWVPPARPGPVTDLELHAASRGEVVEVRVRARGPDGSPRVGVAVRVASGDGADARALTTDSRGWATTELRAPPRLGGGVAEGGTPSAPVSIVASCLEDGLLARRRLVLSGESVVLPDADAPDLVAARDLSFRAGRVRQVVLDVSPPSLAPGEEARVRVQMLDVAGLQVAGEGAHVAADAGRMGPLTVLSDGSMEARYVAPPDDSRPRVQITASSGEASAAVGVPVTPRPVRGALSIAVGWTTDMSDAGVAYGQLALSGRSPGWPDALWVRGSVRALRRSFAAADAFTGQTVAVAATVVPVDLGVELVRRSGRRSLATGVSAVVAPYRLAVDYGGRRGLDGLGLSRVGGTARAAARMRFGMAEGTLEAAYTFLDPGTSAVVFEGGVGGASLAAGYRLLW
jgi:hypothetical protein